MEQNTELRDAFSMGTKALLKIQIVTFLMGFAIAMLLSLTSHFDSPADLERILTSSFYHSLEIGMFTIVTLLVFSEYYSASELQERYRRSPMKRSTFFFFIVLFIMGSQIFDFTSLYLDKLFELFGLTIREQVDAATGVDYDHVMWVYACFVAPIIEEIVFRGYIQARLEKANPYGAIVLSAILFGLYHGNLPQGIFATFLGLILGYISYRYGLVYAILFHFINNFGITVLFSALLPIIGKGALDTIIFLFFLLGVVLLFLKRDAIARFRDEHHPGGHYILEAFSSRYALILTTLLIVQMILLTETI
ncbi:CPBP family intramembrane glutamic endopeptidase [Guggenheimella bovis]